MLAESFRVAGEVAVDMSVEEVAWPTGIDKPAENAKSPVGQIFFITKKTGWGMGHHDIGAAFEPEKKPHLFNETAHLFFRILIDLAIIPSAAGKADNAGAAYADQSAVKSGTANRRRLPVADIMVAKDVVQRYIVEITQGCQIFRREISTGDDRIHLVAAALFLINQRRVYHVGNKQKFHFNIADAKQKLFRIS